MANFIFQEIPHESPLPSGVNTPQRMVRDTRHVVFQKSGISTDINMTVVHGKVSAHAEQLKTVTTLDDDSDIDPDELLSVYLETKAKLFHLQPPSPTTLQKAVQRGRGGITASQKKGVAATDYEVAKLSKKLQKIETDILFDQYIADQQWEKRRIQLEKEAAAERRATSDRLFERLPCPTEVSDESEVDINRETARINTDDLDKSDSDDDTTIAGLFASLPVSEVHPVTGKSTVVINSSDGTKVTVRDFGKSAGMNPRRVLEEACKAR